MLKKTLCAKSCLMTPYTKAAGFSAFDEIFNYLLHFWMKLTDFEPNLNLYSAEVLILPAV